MVNVRRVVLDAILLEAAAEAGAEVRTETAVTGLVEEGDRVVGVRTAASELRAPLVVGADGTHSTVARLVQAGEYNQTAPGRLFLWAYFEGGGGDRSSVWLGKIGDLGYLASPTDSGLFMAAVAPSVDRAREALGDRDAAYSAGVAGWPELEATLAGARRVGPVRVMARWHGFFRPSAGPGWVLVGDAGHFKDPTAGQGISDALRQTVTLATAIEAALGATGNGNEPLDDWWSWRDRDAWEMYWFARDMGASGPTSVLTHEIQRRIAADPQLTDGLLRVLNHDVAPSQVFTPALALAATSTVLRSRRGQRRIVLEEARDLVVDQVRHRGPPRHPPGSRRGRLGRQRLGRQWV